MGKLYTPISLKETTHWQKEEYSMQDLTTAISIGDYALVLGREVILDTDQDEFVCNDSENVLLDTVLDILETSTNLHILNRGEVHNFADLTDKYSVLEIKKSILQILNPQNKLWSFDCGDINPSLLQLLQSGIFKTIVVTTFEPYVENVLREKWGDQIRVYSLWDEKKNYVVKDFSNAPTLYYAFGKADYTHPENTNFVVSDHDRLRTIQYLLSRDAESFLNVFSKQHLLSIGNKMDDWLFRFFWYAITHGTDNCSTRNRVIQSFSSKSDSDEHLKKYLKKLNVLLSDSEQPREFLKKLNENLRKTQKSFLAESNSVGGVFLSYAHEDLPLAIHVYRALKNANINVWMDIRMQETEEGIDYDAAIQNAIGNAKVFIPILTPHIVDILQGQNHRYVVDTEWKTAYQYMGGDKSRGQLLFPIASVGYDERAEYHSRYFEGHYFKGIVGSTVHRLDSSANGLLPIENIIGSLKKILQDEKA